MKKMKTPRGTARARRRWDMISFNKAREERRAAEAKACECVTVQITLTRSA